MSNAKWNRTAVVRTDALRFYARRASSSPLACRFITTTTAITAQEGLGIAMTATLSLEHTAVNTVETLPPQSPREVLSCPHCRLVQFIARNHLCRRCRKGLTIVEPEPLPFARPEPFAASAHTSPEVVKQLGARIRELRKQRSLSQRGLASLMNVPRTYISKIETGRAIPSLASMERLATALRVRITVLLLDSSARRAAHLSALLADPFLAEIASVLPRMDALARVLTLRAAREAAEGTRLWAMDH
jgi:transcriptional regulator with XRE-family HTH domain